MTYTIINREDIPPTPPATNERYGEWLALARTMNLMEANRAVCIDLAGINPAIAVSSLHSATRQIGIKVSTMRVGSKLYAVRVGVRPAAAPPRRKFTCKHCQLPSETSLPNQEYCSAEKCQKARRSKKNLDYKARRRREK